MRFSVATGTKFQPSHQPIRGLAFELSSYPDNTLIAARGLRARQFVHGAPASIALSCGAIWLAWLPLVVYAEYVSPITASPTPNDHWLLQFQWPRSNPSSLIQTFPK